jgi:SAM-dependent methyltransferase
MRDPNPPPSLDSARRRPLPATEAHDRPRIFSPEYYRKLEQVEQNNPWSMHMQRLALALLGRFDRSGFERVLDAGCGAGFFTLLWRERCRPRVAAGVDSSFDGLTLCRARGLNEVAACSVTALGFRPAVFDAIYCADVLQHLGGETAGLAISEFARVLRPGGVLLIRTAARRGIGRKKHRDAADYQQWDPQKLRGLLESRGFLIEWMSLVNWLPSLAADLRALGKPAPSGDVGLGVRAAEREGAGNARQTLLAAYWALERLVLLRLGGRLPGGHTLLVLARKA